MVIDLLDSDTFLKFSSNYSQLEATLTNSPHRIVVIDEIQKLPQLLNAVLTKECCCVFCGAR